MPGLCPGERLLFIGDSITDCERQGVAKPLGFGYVQLVAALLACHRPDLGLDVRNRGVSGDTILDLERRWEVDVIDERPDRLFVMVGVNDVINRHVPHRVDLAVSDDVYRATYDRLLDRAQSAGITRIALLEPSCLDLPIEDIANRELRRLAVIVGEIAERRGIDRIRIFDRLGAVVDGGFSAGWYSDPTHPYFSGHTMMALAVAEYFGLALTPMPGEPPA